MIITYYGICCFKVQSGDVVLALDPYTKEAGVNQPRFQANLVASTRQHPLHNNIDSLSGNPFIIAGPGEYETNGIIIEGIMENYSTLYIIEWEGMRLCHLGALPDKNITERTRERIGTPDILFLPVGGSNSLDAEEAAQVMSNIEPRIVIPMYYAFPGLQPLGLTDEKKFLDEVGGSPTAEEKLTIKKKDVPQDEVNIMLLNPLASK